MLPVVAIDLTLDLEQRLRYRRCNRRGWFRLLSAASLIYGCVRWSVRNVTRTETTQAILIAAQASTLSRHIEFILTELFGFPAAQKSVLRVEGQNREIAENLLQREPRLSD